MTPDPNASERLSQAAHALDEATSAMGRGILALDESRVDCASLSERYSDFARRMATDYPSLAGPATRLSELFAELDSALGRLTVHTENAVVTADRITDSARRSLDGLQAPD